MSLYLAENLLACNNFRTVDLRLGLESDLSNKNEDLKQQ